MPYKNIRDLRIDNDLSQREMAEILNISQQTYSTYEIATRDIPTQILIAIADYYDVSIDYLLGRTVKKEINK